MLYCSFKFYSDLFGGQSEKKGDYLHNQTGDRKPVPVGSMGALSTFLLDIPDVTKEMRKDTEDRALNALMASILLF